MEPVETETATPVAVIGVGCRFPGGVEDLDGFWQLLADGIDAIGDIPPDRWSVLDFADPDPATPERTEVRQGGFLRGDKQPDQHGRNCRQLQIQVAQQPDSTEPAHQRRHMVSTNVFDHFSWS